MKDALSDAQSFAIGSDHASVEPGHVLSSLIADKNSSTVGILQQAGADVGAIRDQLEVLLRTYPIIGHNQGQISFSSDLVRVLSKSDVQARKSGDAYISVDQVLGVLIEVMLWRGPLGVITRSMRKDGGKRGFVLAISVRVLVLRWSIALWQGLVLGCFDALLARNGHRRLFG